MQYSKQPLFALSGHCRSAMKIISTTDSAGLYDMTGGKSKTWWLREEPSQKYIIAQSSSDCHTRNAGSRDVIPDLRALPGYEERCSAGGSVDIRSHL